jgi:hypothetical protein
MPVAWKSRPALFAGVELVDHVQNRLPARRAARPSPGLRARPATPSNTHTTQSASATAANVCSRPGRESRMVARGASAEKPPVSTHRKARPPPAGAVTRSRVTPGASSTIARCARDAVEERLPDVRPPDDRDHRRTGADGRCCCFHRTHSRALPACESSAHPGSTREQLGNTFTEELLVSSRAFRPTADSACRYR